MSLDPLSSIGKSSVGNASGLSAPISPMGGAGRAPAEGDDFSAMLTQMASDTVSALQNAENASMAGLRGQVDPRVVAESVMQAEQSLQTSIAVRDKLVAAFQEITRMQI